MKKLLLLAGFVLSLTTVQGQEKAGEAAVTNSLQNHYNRLKSNANNYREHKREYKVIEVKDLQVFWHNVLETVRANAREQAKAGKETVDELANSRKLIAQQASQIAALKKENALKEQAVQRSTYEVDNIFILGMGLNKQFFVFLSFGLIGALLLVAAVIFHLYKKSRVITDQKIRDFQEIDQEFAEYKKTARDRELKIKRELQTEMNAHEELKQKMASLQKVTH